eukprot:5374646-Amphidinium_carterae.1
MVAGDDTCILSFYSTARQAVGAQWVELMELDFPLPCYRGEAAQYFDDAEDLVSVDGSECLVVTNEQDTNIITSEPLMDLQLQPHMWRPAQDLEGCISPTLPADEQAGANDGDAKSDRDNVD